MSQYTTVIFDLDGTLLNTLDDLADGVNMALRIHGMPERTIDEVRMAVGNGVVRLMELSVPNGRQNSAFEACLASFRTEYAKISRNKTRPYDGIPAMLEKLHHAGMHMAVVSNKYHDAVVALVQEYFPIIPIAAGEREAEGIKKKPAPDTVLAVMQQFGVSADQCVYVGDSDVDIATAQNAGMDCIAVTWGFRDEDFLLKNGATILADSPTSLLEKIL